MCLSRWFRRGCGRGRERGPGRGGDGRPVHAAGSATGLTEFLLPWLASIVSLDAGVETVGYHLHMLAGGLAGLVTRIGGESSDLWVRACLPSGGPDDVALGCFL
jgi:hypothetical protein